MIVMVSGKKNGVKRAAEPRGSRPLRIFVKIGALRRFDALKQKTADLPVEVSWDRRRGERRNGSDDAGADQRLDERRQKPPFTWEVADFVVVEERPAAVAPRPKRATAAKGTRRR